MIAGRRVHRAGPSQVARRSRSSTRRSHGRNTAAPRTRSAGGWSTLPGAARIPSRSSASSLTCAICRSTARQSSEMYRPLAQTFMFPMAFAVRTDGDPAALAAAVRQASRSRSTARSRSPRCSRFGADCRVARQAASARDAALGVCRASGSRSASSASTASSPTASGSRSVSSASGSRSARPPPRSASGSCGTAPATPSLGWSSVCRSALGLAGLLQAALFGIAPRDPATFTGLPLAVVLATLAACVLPARRAARVDPVRTMRAE